MNTKERILDVARDMIATSGYHSTTTAALAGRAGISEGTIYRHFKSKEDILIQILKDLNDRYSRFILDLRSRIDGGPGTVETVVKEHLRFVEQNVADIKIVLSSYAYLDPSKRSMTTVIERMGAFFEEHLERAMESGLINRIPARKDALLMVTLLLGLLRLRLYWPELEDLSEEAVEFCRRSIGSE